MLIEKGADVNKLNDNGDSPLVLAVQQANLVIAERLLEAGAQTELADPPLSHQHERGHAVPVGAVHVCARPDQH